MPDNGIPDGMPFSRAEAVLEIHVQSGDILQQSANVLVCPGNVQLNMSGGINGQILMAGGDAIQQQLHQHLRGLGHPHVEPGTVVQTDAGSLQFGHLLHAVAINAFYESSVELVADTIVTALRLAAKLSARTVALAALATGYGPLTMEQFAEAAAKALRGDYCPVERVVIVVRHPDEAAVVETAMNDAMGGVSGG